MLQQAQRNLGGADWDPLNSLGVATTEDSIEEDIDRFINGKTKQPGLSGFSRHGQAKGKFSRKTQMHRMVAWLLLLIFAFLPAALDHKGSSGLL